jgi:hypothetical protein
MKCFSMNARNTPAVDEAGAAIARQFVAGIM